MIRPRQFNATNRPTHADLATTLGVLDYAEDLRRAARPDDRPGRHFEASRPFRAAADAVRTLGPYVARPPRQGGAHR